jgi:predicted RNase H-like HicB family nuclease
VELTVRIHSEDGGYWADVPDLPGCFATGDTLDELFESLREGIALYLAEDGPPPGGPMHVATAVLSDRPLIKA